jgi:hypothetical protein
VRALSPGGPGAHGHPDGILPSPTPAACHGLVGAHDQPPGALGGGLPTSHPKNLDRATVAVPACFCPRRRSASRDCESATATVVGRLASHWWLATSNSLWVCARSVSIKPDGCHTHHGATALCCSLEPAHISYYMQLGSVELRGRRCRSMATASSATGRTGLWTRDT